MTIETVNSTLATFATRVQASPEQSHVDFRNDPLYEAAFSNKETQGFHTAAARVALMLVTLGAVTKGDPKEVQKNLEKLIADSFATGFVLGTQAAGAHEVAQTALPEGVTLPATVN